MASLDGDRHFQICGDDLPQPHVPTPLRWRTRQSVGVPPDLPAKQQLPDLSALRNLLFECLARLAGALGNDPEITLRRLVRLAAALFPILHGVDFETEA